MNDTPPKPPAEAKLIEPTAAEQREVMDLYNKVDHLSRYADVPPIRAGAGQPQDGAGWQRRHARARSGTAGVTPEKGFPTR
jgi:hypothetical protein